MFHKVLHTVPDITKNTKFTCPICNKVFQKHSLRYHLRQHTKEKIFVCQLCQLTFSRKQALKQHLKVMHESEEDQDQNAKEKTKVAPKKTKTKKKKEKTFKCEVCEKEFKLE